MAKIVFVNPNDPEQPASGVYRWFYLKDGTEVTIYVGRAGARQRSIPARCTLQRGVFEAQRSCITSNRGTSLDTDFIIGSALQYLKSRGHDCYWQHIADDPRQEAALCARYRPVLQYPATTILRAFRRAKPDGTPWTNNDGRLAEQLLSERFAKHLPE